MTFPPAWGIFPRREMLARPAMAPASRPLKGCPARSGDDWFSVEGAEFVFCAEDCRNAGEPVTEVFGFFCRPGWRDDPRDEDMVQTAGLEVPAGSPLSRMAHQADTPAGRSLMARKLRRVIAQCPCADVAGCAALDEVNLVAAIEHAARWAGPPWNRGRRTLRGLRHA